MLKGQSNKIFLFKSFYLGPYEQAKTVSQFFLFFAKLLNYKIRNSHVIHSVHTFYAIIFAKEKKFAKTFLKKGSKIL